MSKKLETVSSGGLVTYRGKILLLYKNRGGNSVGWVMPKGTVEAGESIEEAALREVFEEAEVKAKILNYIGKTGYNFYSNDTYICKTVHWFLMEAPSFHCRPQKEEFFMDAGFYKKHEALHLVKFHDERKIIRSLCINLNKL